METKFQPRQHVFFLEKNAVKLSTIASVDIHVWSDINTGELRYKESYNVFNSDSKFSKHELHKTKESLLNSL